MTHKYAATVAWSRGGQVFTDRRYSRAHEWRFDGLTVPASSSPSVVRLPLSREDAIDPEEALVASLSSCHMLFFLDFAARDGFRIDAYTDNATGEMGKTADGGIWMSKVTLAPRIAFSGDKRPSADDIARLHRLAHEHCYIANSVRSEVVIADAVNPS
ncbi:MAG: OsmC family protein [Hyphomicrobiaceae bacterium]